MCSKSSGWLSTATLPCLVWGFSSRYFEPDHIVEENVVAFKDGFQTLLGFLNEQRADILKHVFARPPLDSEVGSEESGRMYALDSTVFSPSDLGVPADRWRIYGSYTLHPYVGTRKLNVDFDELFFRELKCDGSVYFKETGEAAREAELLACRHEEASDEHGYAACSELGLEALVLSQGDYSRLEGHGVMAKRKNIDCANRSLSLVNVRQTAEFTNRVHTERVPALLTRSLIYDLSREKLVLTCEHWAIQWFPHPHVCTSALLPAMPFSIRNLQPDGPVTYVSQKRMTGNAMHKAAVAVWIIYSLLKTDKSLLLRDTDTA